MKAALTLIRINMKAIARDGNAIFWSFVFPALLLVGLGLIWGRSGGTPTLRVGLVGAPDSPVLPRLERALRETRLFRISRGSESRELAALREGERHLVLVCPAPRRPAPAVVRAHYDSRQEESAQLVLASVRQVVTQIERQMISQPVTLKLQEASIRPKGERRRSPVESFMAAIIAMTIIQAGLAAAVSLVSDRQRGSADIFRVPPISPAHMVAGSLAARVLIGAVQALAVVVTGAFAFKIPLQGSWWLLGLLVTLGTLAFTAIGAALAMLAKNVDAISGLISLVSLPLLFLSGLFFPVDTLPGYLRTFAMALPSAYLGDGLRWAISGIGSIAPLSVSLAILSAWTLVCFLLSVKFYRWN
jgi:ABC-2 type transport system permease protein